VIYLQPKNPQSHYNLAVFHARTGDQAKAIEFCQKAIELNPNYEPARQLLKQLESAP
jgi:tetratricopeptide (TPR) repeat protein